MSEIKAGDKIYFQGNQGKVMRVISDENEPLLEVVLTQKRVAYLNSSQLDLYPFAEQLNENQQIVLEWLKGSYVQGYGAAVIRTIHLLQKENTVDISDSSYVRGAYRDLNTAEEAVVVKMFADWALEQEEE